MTSIKTRDVFADAIANNPELFPSGPTPSENLFADAIASNPELFKRVKDDDEEDPVSLESVKGGQNQGTAQQLRNESDTRDAAQLNFSASRALEDPVTDDGLDLTFLTQDQKEQRLNEATNAMFQITNEDLPNTDENILNLAKFTNADFESVKENFGWFSRSVEAAKNDPVKWRRQNPELAKMLLEDPRSAGLLNRDKTVLKFSFDVDEAIRGAISFASTGNPLALPLGLSQGLGIDLSTVTQLAQDKGGLSLPAATIDVLETAAKNIELGAKGSQLLVSEMLNGRSSEESLGVAEEVLRLQQDIGEPRHYGGLSGVEQTGLSLLEIVSNQAPNLAAIGAGSAVGAATSVVATPVAGVVAGGITAKALGSMYAMVAETGSSYLQYRDLVDDDGKRVDQDLAMAGAILAGAMSTAVEFASFGIQFKSFKELIGVGGVKKAVSDMVVGRTSARVLKALLSHLAQSGITEGGEEGLQQMLTSTGAWLTKVASSGKFQETNIAGGLSDAAEASFIGAVSGVVGVGGLRGAIHAGVGATRIRRAKINAKIIEAANEMSKGTMARGAPQVVADFVARKSEAGGQKVGSFFADPVLIKDLLSAGDADLKTNLREVFGDNGQERLDRAISEYHNAPGGRTTFEIPMAEYLEKVGPTPLGGFLTQHMAAERGGFSGNDILTMEALEGQLAEQIKNDPTVLEGEKVSEQETQFSELMLKALTETHGIKQEEASGLVATARARIRILADSAGVNITTMFDDWSSFYGKEDNSDELASTSEAVNAAEKSLSKARDVKVSGISSGLAGFDQLILDTDGEQPSDADTSKQDSEFRKFLIGRRGKGIRGPKKPKPFDGGLLDPVNEFLGLEGKKKVSGLAESFTKLMAKNTGPAHIRIKKTIETMNEVEGVNISLPEDLQSQIDAAELFVLDAERELEHFEGLAKAAGLDRDADIDSFYQASNIEGLKGFEEIKSQGIKDAVSHFIGNEQTVEGLIDRSTIAYFDMLSKLQSHEGAGARIKGDYLGLRTWLGAVDGAPLTTGQAKQLSEGFRRYIVEGNAPSVDLVAPMSALRLFMVRVYARVKAVVGIEISGPVRGIFDRMLATDAEIAEVKDSIGFDVKLWKDLAESNMTEKEKTVYFRDKITDQQVGAMKVQAAIHKAQLRLAKTIRSREFKKFENVAERQWNARKDVRAFTLLTKGEITTSSGNVVKSDVVLDIEEFRERFGKNTPLEKRLGGALAVRGEDIDVFASSVGYDVGRSGDAMVSALANMPVKDEFIKQAATTLMRVQNPGLDGEISDLSALISKTLHGRDAEKWLVREFAAVGRRAEGGSIAAGTFANNVAKSAAKRTVSQAKAGSIDIKNAMRQERWTARKARGEIAKGKLDTARELLQQRLLAFHTWKETSRAVRIREEMVDSLVELSRAGFRDATSKGLGSELLFRAADQVISSMGIENSGEFRITDFSQAIEGIRKSDGGAAFDFDDAADLLTSPPEGGWQNGTVQQMELYGKILKQLKTVAARRVEVVIDGKKRKLGDVLAEIKLQASSRFDRTEFNKRIDKTAWVKRKTNETIANNAEASQLFKQLGPTVFDTLWVGMIDAEATKSEIILEVEGTFGGNWSKLPSAIEKTKFDLFTSRQLEDLNLESYNKRATRNTPKDRLWMLQIALNMGTRSNRDKLLAGYEWNEKTILKFLHDNMTDLEWDFVQGTWDSLGGKFYNAMAKTRAKSSGLRPGEIEPLEIKTRSGSVRGGFIPVIYDKNETKNQQSPLDTKSNGQAAAALSIGAGFAQKRSESHGDAVLLEWGVVPSYVMNVAHYVAFDELLNTAKNVILSDDFRKTVESRIGVQAYANLIDDKVGWLASLSGSNTDPVPAPLENTAFFMDAGRTMFTTGTVAWRVLLAGNAVSEAMGFAFTSKDAPSVKFISKAYSDWALQGGAVPFKNPKELREFMRINPDFRFHQGAQFKRAMNLGREFRLRKANREAGIRNDMLSVEKTVIRRGKLGKIAATRDALINSQGMFFDAFDSFSSTIVWNAAFEEAQANGLGEKDAARKADIVMSVNMPSATDPRRSAVMREKRGSAAWLALYGWFSHRSSLVFGRIDDTVQEIRKTTSKRRQMLETSAALGSLMAAMAIMDVFSDALTSPTRKEDEEESAIQFVVEAMVSSVFTFHAIGRIGSPGKAIGKYISGQEVSYWDLVNGELVATSMLVNVVKLLVGVLDSEAPTPERILDALEAVGIVLPFPTGSREVNAVNRAVFGDD